MTGSLALLAALTLSQSQGENAFRIVETTESAMGRFEITLKTHRFLGNSKVGQLANTQLAALERTFVSSFKNGTIGPGPIRHPHTLDLATQLFVNRRNLVSVLIHQFEYTGGAHPNQFFHCITIGGPAGKENNLTSTSLVAGKVQRDQLEALLLSKLKARDAAWVVEGTVKELNEMHLSNFVVRDSGMTWFFNPYDMGPYVQGPFKIDCSWKELAPILDRKVAPLLMGGV